MKFEKRKLYDELNSYNEKKEEIAKEIGKLDAKKMNLSKKSYKGKLWDKKTLLKIIEEKED